MEKERENWEGGKKERENRERGSGETGKGEGKEDTVIWKRRNRGEGGSMAIEKVEIKR